MTIELGRLQTVDPRKVWPHEAHHFTPWLLENVDVLSDLLGMDLVLEAAEHPVGDFSLDLIGSDESTGERVIVENQLERSDHTHLGQIITYAAGTDPTTIVWVATGFRPEHRAAIDWLNERTDENTRVFGVVIRVVQIGESAIAPNFELVAQPNDWEKTVRRSAAQSGAPSEKAIAYEAFWEQFLIHARESGASWVPRGRTTRDSWLDSTTGVPGVKVSMFFRRDRLVVQVYFDSSDAGLNLARYEALRQAAPTFEQAAGPVDEWDPMEGRKGTRANYESSFESALDQARWPQINDWLIERQQTIRAGLDAIGYTTLFAEES